MSTMHRLTILALVFFGAQTIGTAWASSAPVNYSATAWRVEEGLPDDTIQSLAETPDGALWIGTAGGLARFDGNHFTIFNSRSTPAFKENGVHCLAGAKNGGLWIGTEGSGLVLYRDGAFRSWSASDGLTDPFVRAINQDRQGTLWIGTNNGFFRLAGEKMLRIDGANGIPSLAVNAIIEDASGDLWIGGSQLMSIHSGHFQEHPLPGESSRNRIKSLLQTSDGAIWVGTVSGLYRSQDGVLPFRKVPGVRGTVRALHQGDGRTLWMSIVGQGGAVWNARPDAFRQSPQLRISGTVLSIFEDHEQNFWVGTQSGLIRYSRTALRVIPIRDARSSDFGTIFIDTNRVAWFASTRLVGIQGDRVEPLTFRKLGSDKIRNVLRDRDGSLWIGTDGSGLYHLVNRQTTRYTTANGLVNNFIRVITQDRDGSLWVGTDEGVSHLRKGRMTNYGIRDGLAYFSIRFILVDHLGGVWIGTDQGLSHFVRGAFTSDGPVQALAQEKVWAIHEDNDGGLWFGTRNHGLYRYRNDHLTQFGTGNGLVGDAIYAILEDSAAHMWMSGPNGVWYLNRHELDAWADEPDLMKKPPISSTFFDLPDDTGRSQIFGGVQGSGSLGVYGGAWFPSNQGVVHISIPENQPVSPPQIEIDRVAGDHLSQPWTTGANKVELAPGNSRVEFRWDLNSLSPQQNARFLYRLRPFDQSWIDAREVRNASYSNLPPGDYAFEVAAFEANNPGVYSSARLLVTKNSYFYRRWWFLCFAAAAFATILSAFVRARVRRIRNRFVATLEERNRIAREIHDTVIQGCTSVSAVLEAVSTIPHDQPQIREDLLGRARAQIRDTINEARRAVWNLRKAPSPESLQNLLATMVERARQESGLPVSLAVRGAPFSLPAPAAREVLMIAREAVHNAVLHSSATQISVLADFGDRELLVEISDDGNGFEPSDEPRDRSAHFGLQSMHERATRLMGKIEILSRPGSGTKVQVKVPKEDRRARLNLDAEEAIH
jgi:signal transduction histidine kinase/ligand-binding sensor domain-containing protein